MTPAQENTLLMMVNEHATRASELHVAQAHHPSVPSIVNAMNAYSMVDAMSDVMEILTDIPAHEQIAINNKEWVVRNLLKLEDALTDLGIT